MARRQERFDYRRHHAERIAELGAKAPFLLRITEWRERPVPVLVVKERQYRDVPGADKGNGGGGRRARAVLIERGNLSSAP